MTETTVKVTAYDSSLTPNTVVKEFKSARYTFGLDRDIKVFELGSFAFLMDDLFSGLKLPNYITDFNRSRKVYKVNFDLVEGIDGDDQGELQLAAQQLEFFFDVTCSKYEFNRLRAGAIETDICDATSGGTGYINGRIKNFYYEADKLENGRIPCSFEFWTGYAIRVMEAGG